MRNFLKRLNISIEADGSHTYKGVKLKRKKKMLN